MSTRDEREQFLRRQKKRLERIAARYDELNSGLAELEARMQIEASEPQPPDTNVRADFRPRKPR